ncbi:MAG: HAMP domain-containing sensor histidine kinase [Erysipelotrichia bacterium]|nr:HAMP domain-containing sensor histidine kinase [Erysipelotrichia bacterium]
MTKKHSLISGKIIAVFIYILGILGTLLCGIAIVVCYHYGIYFSDQGYNNSSLFTNKVESTIYDIYDFEQIKSSSSSIDGYTGTSFLKNLNDYLDQMNLNYRIYCNENVYAENSFEDGKSTTYYNYMDLTDEAGDYIEVYYGLDSSKPYSEEISLEAKIYDLLYSWRYYFIAFLIVFVLILVVDVIYLCITVGKNNKDDQEKLNEIDKIPFDLYLLIVVGLIVLVTALMSNMLYYSSYYIIHLVAITVYFMLIMLVGLSVLLTFVNRIKCGSFFKNTLIYILLKYFWEFTLLIYHIIKDLFLSIPLIWKSIIFVIIFIWIVPYSIVYRRQYLFIHCFSLSAIVLYYSYFLAKIKVKTKQMVSGDFDKPLDTKGMTPELTDYALKLENINDGVSSALDAKMKSERLKTELITNVSHDIKTPLTSIINYVDLLKRHPDEQQREEYLNILDKQSKRLKKLTEDIVEFSKVSTGNIKVKKELIYGNEILKQTIGEYEEILKNNDLELICQYADNDEQILTDGKLTWRILNNCLNNIVKYSKKNTRVYIKSEITANDFVITMKNVSEKMLNISADALMERFVRGDASRNTEGSGLGLSIASDLATILGGKFIIDIDGDLFKVTFSLPKNGQDIK